MLEGAWAGQGPVLGDVTHEQHGHALLTRERAQLDRGLAHLAHRARRTVEAVDLDRLHRVDHQQRRRPGRGSRDDDGHVGAREHAQGAVGRTAEEPQTLSAEVQLSGRFFRAGIEHACFELVVSHGRGEGSRQLQHERGLADARLTAEQQHGAWHEAAAQQAVDLSDTGGSSLEPGGLERSQRLRLGERSRRAL